VWLIFDVGQKMNLLSNLKRLLWLRKYAKRSIKYDADGFTVYFGDAPSKTIQWDRVREIVALKQDHFSCDSICFGFRCDDSGVYESVGEHEVDFGAFSRLVASRFQGFRTDWYEKVVQPPFAENWTIVWPADCTSKAQPGARANTGSCHEPC
jgi:hypothetical protein